MKLRIPAVAVAILVCVCASVFAADEAKPGLLSAPELRHVVPAAYFFRGHSATVQLRNAAGFRAKDGKFVIAALVDTSGYSHDVAEKYQGLLISEVKISIEGSDLAPGEYGFGFTKDGKFIVMDVGANDLVNESAQTDENLRRPVPLKMEIEKDGAYRLYAGRNWVSIEEK